MKRILTIGALCCSWCGCHEKPGGANHDLSFSVDTAQIKRMDSLTAARRLSDSILLQQANSAPGINAGAGNFAIGKPAGWRRVDTLLGKIGALILDTPSTHSGFRTNISIVSDSMRGLSADNYLGGAINNIAAYAQQFSLIGKGIRPVAGRSAHWVHYSENADGTDLENICYIITDKGIAYIITCSALKGQLLQNFTAFERTIQSFTLR
jgi:hypothetical protein